MARLYNTDIRVPDGWAVGTTRDGGGVARYETSEGSVDIAYFEVMPGVLLTRIDLACQTLPASNPLGPHPATVNWCAAGRCEVDFGPRGTMVVGERALCVSSANAQSFSYPTGAYRGFEYFVDLGQIDEPSWALLEALCLSHAELGHILLISVFYFCLALCISCVVYHVAALVM